MVFLINLVESGWKGVGIPERDGGNMLWANNIPANSAQEIRWRCLLCSIVPNA
jgi:hypothetical protein